jgi:hypothetical protein
MLSKLVVVAGVLGLGVACGGDPCQDYVDYMCACHGDDTGFSCSDLERVYDEADPSVQEQCQIDLSAQQDQDDADGESCTAG